MPIIKQLSPHEAHKIAAGEVVERPANIVKELLENALDASATHISVYIEDGGKQLIRIVDNGTGMDEEDALACFNKHATSKITHIDELESINTFGFRGEALASVAAVARVTLITKHINATVGIKVSVECSAVTNTQPIAATTGTDIRVHDLFYTIPARKKFLKKKETEWRHTVQLFQAFCLAFPHIHFKLYHDDVEVHNCPATTDSSQRFAQLWQQHNLLTFDEQRVDGTLAITGTLSTHPHYRYDRSALFFFVNNRWVKNGPLASALIKGYQGLIPDGKYPMACIKITVDSTLVDINIHPRKEEVAFMYPLKVTALISNAIKNTLDNHTSINLRNNNGVPTAYPPNPTPFSQFKHTAPSVFTPCDFGTITDMPENKSHTAPTHVSPPSLTPQKHYASESSPYNPPPLTSVTPTHASTLSYHTTPLAGETTTPPTLPAYREEPSHQLPLPDTHTDISTNSHQNTEEYHSFTIIGQLHKTYILIEHEEGLYLVDQHAAHERILYELFAQRFVNQTMVNLLFPPIIDLSAHDYATIMPHMNLFTHNGITLEPMGSHQLIIRATPIHLKEINLEELVRQVIGWINEQGNADHEDFFKIINEKLHAQCACKAAVKAGDTLTHEQMHRILTDLYKTKNRATCPHGRPTGFLVSLDEIEKKVKRKK